MGKARVPDPFSEMARISSGYFFVSMECPPALFFGHPLFHSCRTLSIMFVRSAGRGHQRSLSFSLRGKAVAASTPLPPCWGAWKVQVGQRGTAGGLKGLHVYGSAALAPQSSKRWFGSQSANQSPQRRSVSVAGFQLHGGSWLPGPPPCMLPTGG